MLVMKRCFRAPIRVHESTGSLKHAVFYIVGVSNISVASVPGRTLYLVWSTNDIQYVLGIYCETFTSLSSIEH